jgi:hypothetical protein
MPIRISNLYWKFLVIRPFHGVDTYKVVALRVKVKLIEKMAKSHAGNVRVMKVISQYRIPGMTFKKKRTKFTVRPAHVREEDVTAETVAVTTAVARGSNPLGGPIEVIELAVVWETEEIVEVSKVEVEVAGSEKFVERLNAIVAY